MDANNEIIALGYGDIQKPVIDDNHDGVGHIVNAWGHLPSTGDGIKMIYKTIIKFTNFKFYS